MALLRSIVTTTALLLLATTSAATDSTTSAFAGVFTRTSVSPSACIAPNSCDYRCSAAYNITVSDVTATLRPTTRTTRCICETLTATIAGNTASGNGTASQFSLELTSTGVTATVSVAGHTCTSAFTNETRAMPSSSPVHESSAPEVAVTSSAQATGSHRTLIGWALSAGVAIPMYFA